MLFIFPSPAHLYLNMFLAFNSGDGVHLGIVQCPGSPRGVQWLQVLCADRSPMLAGNPRSPDPAKAKDGTRSPFCWGRSDEGATSSLSRYPVFGGKCTFKCHRCAWLEETPSVALCQSEATEGRAGAPPVPPSPSCR